MVKSISFIVNGCIDVMNLTEWFLAHLVHYVVCVHKHPKNVSSVTVNFDLTLTFD